MRIEYGWGAPLLIGVFISHSQPLSQVAAAQLDGAASLPLSHSPHHITSPTHPFDLVPLHHRRCSAGTIGCGWADRWVRTLFTATPPGCRWLTTTFLRVILSLNYNAEHGCCDNQNTLTSFNSHDDIWTSLSKMSAHIFYCHYVVNLLSLRFFLLDPSLAYLTNIRTLCFSTRTVVLQCLHDGCPVQPEGCVRRYLSLVWPPSCCRTSRITPAPMFKRMGGLQLLVK